MVDSNLAMLFGSSAPGIPRTEPEPATLSLIDYTRRMFPGYRAAAHHRALASALERVERGECKRLMVFMPPRHGKSELVSVRFPAWYLGRHPDKRFIGTSYAARLAERFSGQARNQFNDERWPYTATLATDTQSKAMWDLAGNRGGYIAAGVGGPITGQGGHMIVIDDPVKNREEADSETVRDSVWDWYQSTLYTRLEEDGAIILVMTRWHEDDLAGRLLNEAQQGGDQWEVIELPALDAAGEALWPEKYDRARLEQIRATIGSRNWTALYQQRPTLEEGAMFKRQWFTGTADEPHIVDETPWNLRWVRYWDLAASTKTSADYTASASVAIDGDGVLWIRDLIRGRWEWPDAKRIMRENMLGEVRNTSHVVEEALHGIAALQELRRDPALHGIPLYGYRVDRDKVQRAMAWASRAEAGKVRLVRGEWVNAFLDEVCSFPLATHDDQVDAVSGAVATYAARPVPITKRVAVRM